VAGRVNQIDVIESRYSSVLYLCFKLDAWGQARGRATPALRVCDGMLYQGSPGGRGRKDGPGRSLAYHGTAHADGSVSPSSPPPSVVSAQSSTVSNLIRCQRPCLRRPAASPLARRPPACCAAGQHTDTPGSHLAPSHTPTPLCSGPVLTRPPTCAGSCRNRAGTTGRFRRPGPLEL